MENNNKKIIAYSPYWVCENLDLNSNIIEQGLEILYNDNTTELVKSLDDVQYKMANDEEKHTFYNRRGFAFVGDEVKVTKGRTLPIGSVHKIKNFFRYYVEGTYKKEYVDYVVFEDGKKINIHNIELIVENKFNSWVQEYSEYCITVGGRL